MKTPEEKKAAQAAAHKRWRESEKGKAWKAAYKLTAKARQTQERLQEERKKPE